MNMQAHRRASASAARLRCAHQHMRRWLLRNPWVRPMATLNYAAALIQSLARRFLLRRVNLVERKKKKKRTKNLLLGKYMRCLERYRDAAAGARPAWVDAGFSSFCATKIQSVFRMNKLFAAIRMKRNVIYQIAAFIIQNKIRSRRLHPAAPPPPARPQRVLSLASQVECALVIQSAWRRFCCKKVYLFYRSLLLDKLKGAPADLLRSIVPGEADLLDKAAGVHIRFRLGGARFPPKVLFKVFTHGPLCDVGSFAPRDAYFKGAYSKGACVKGGPSKQTLPSIRVGARSCSTYSRSEGDDQTDWYRRVDNNAWRCVSVEAIDEAFGAPGAPRECEKSSFHFSSLRRRQDLQASRRRRHRAWMARVLLPGDGGGEDVLKWRCALCLVMCCVTCVRSLALDFEQYAAGWGRAGLSMPSELRHDHMYRAASVKEAQACSLDYRK